MSAVFTVGECLCPVDAGRSRHLESLDELFMVLYRARLQGSGWFEKGVALIVYHPTPAYPVEQLNEWFARFFPCLNLVAVDCHDDGLSLPQLIQEWETKTNLYSDRWQRLMHWMSDCSCNLYSMWNHLCRSETAHQTRTRIPPIVTRIDFYHEFMAELAPHEAHYWDLLSNWSFEANSFSTNELIFLAFLLLQKLSKESQIYITPNRLLLFLFTLESSYHQINPFHNFKHAIDVMQATWQICENIIQNTRSNNKSLTRSHVFLLCLAAIGHDMAHPGTNNNLLTLHNAKMTDKFHDSSILENFHQELFLQLIYDQWPSLYSFLQKFNIIKEAILATDMDLHSDYVTKLSRMDDNGSIPMEILVCLIVKVADISNVTRPLLISSHWAYLITLEFNDCLSLENGVSERNKEDEEVKWKALTPIELAAKFPQIPKGQLYFIDHYAQTFFEKLVDKFPSLHFLLDNINNNKRFWLSKLAEQDITV